jgi:chromate reductase
LSADISSTQKIQILGMAGSLRSSSYNRAALKFAQQSIPSNATFEIIELDDIPLYNQDFDLQMPQPVLNLKEKIREADALLFATPEYNHSISGVLKNAIDWASRPYGKSSWDSKPVAVMGASSGTFGTARAQAHLRQIFATLNMHPLNRPEVMIYNASEKFDKNGNLTDEKIKKKIEELVEALVEWAIKLRINNNTNK